MKKIGKDGEKNSASILKITIILSAAATVGLVAVMPWMNTALFKDQQATKVLQLMMLNVVIISLIHSIQSILQSVNKANYSIYILVIAFSTKQL